MACLRLTISTFLCSFLLSIPAFAEWEKVGEKAGVVIYQKDIENSSLVAFRGEGTVNAPLLRVASVMFDSVRAKEWIPNLGSTLILKWYSPTEFLEYDHVKTPFILKDRDFISKVKMDYDKINKKISFVYENADASEAPEDLRSTNYVRGYLNGTLFHLTSTDNDTKTFVEGEVYGDPKGSVPKWIVNMFQKDWPVATFVNLRKQVAKPDITNHPKMLELMGIQE
jgi:hypothetical protein